MKNYNSK